MRQDWGSGKAKLVKRASSGPEEVVVFLSDLHVPFHSPEAVASALKMIRDLKPHRVVLNGDLSDFHSLSRFNTSMSRLDALQDDIDQTNAIRIKVRQAAPDATVDETEGNHDNRVKTYVAQNARSLASLRALEPGSLFRYKELEINWHPGAGFRLRRDFLVRHGSVTRGEAGASAKAEFNQYGISGISGHTHRLATYRKAGYVPRQWTEQGCLCRIDPDYVKSGVPNWTQGCAVGVFSNKTSNFVVHEVPFLDGKLHFGGKKF
jgi:predicted phosphodiesterase